MKNVQLRPLLFVFMALLLITGFVYPLVVTKIGQAFFLVQANGSLIIDSDGAVRGSSLIAQKFIGLQYFQSRPSATDFDVIASGASNLSPASRAFADARQAREQLWIERGGTVPVPEALLTASASGLDPHLSPEAAYYQVPIVSKARNIDVEKLNVLIARHTEKSILGFIGKPRVNILALNMDLDKL